MNPDLRIIDNIKKNINENKLNNTVAIDDPVLSDDEINGLIDKFYSIRKNKVKFELDKKTCDVLIKTLAKDVYNNIEIDGIENLKNIKNGAIITGNHYSPVDTIPIIEMIKKQYNKEVYIVSLASNLALKSPLDFIVNHKNLIPLKNSIDYLNDKFKPELYKVLNDGNYVIIYPEEQMWNNYRKPRPCKRGAYQFAAEANKPIISCFTELVDTGIRVDDNFNKIKYKLHILKPIYPDKSKSVRQNSIDMSETDYKQKCEAYEKYYNKKLDYTFSIHDIAGLRD